MKSIFRIFSFLLLSSVLVFPIVGQIENSDSKRSDDPYLVGEKLSYVGKLKKLGIFSFTLAQLDFEVAERDTEGMYQINSVARSRGSLVRLFNFKFLLKVDSTVDPKKLHAVKTIKRDEQGKRIRDSIADFDYDETRVTYTETDPNEPTKAPRRVSSEITEDAQDLLTSIYRLRGMDLAVGKTYRFKVSDSGLVYDIPVRITAREQKKSKLGKRWCFKVEPDLFGEGRVIEQKGKLTIWITDDLDRVPVRAELETELGDVTIKLKDYSNIRSQRKPALTAKAK